MEDRLIMSKKELERKTLLDSHDCGKLTLKEVAVKLSLSYRQVKRIWKRYQREREKGLIHKGRKRKPANAHPEIFRNQILEIYQNKYYEFGPTFAAEKLLEDDRKEIHPETLRLWLKAEGLWSRKRKRKTYRERRERRESFGDLLQIDGSIHCWFEGADEKSCLLNIVDDATGISFALLDKGETTEILLRAFKRWIEKYGIPKAVYVDLKSVYVSPKRLKEKYDDDLLIKEGFSVFEQVCKALNIEIIRAYSAQAKGRVERKHGVFQDRLVKDLKLYNIKTFEAANAYLENKFLDKVNNKFAKPPVGIDVHRDASSYGDLNQIFCWKYRRQLKNDWTIQFKREYFQVTKHPHINPQDFIYIRKYLDGSMKLWFHEEELRYYPLHRKPERTFKRYYQLKGPVEPIKLKQIARQRKHKSPWSQFNSGWLSGKNQRDKASNG